jgi:hypothetical protein
MNNGSKAFCTATYLNSGSYRAAYYLLPVVSAASGQLVATIAALNILTTNAITKNCFRVFGVIRDTSRSSTLVQNYYLLVLY